jgi:hypothetical protein
MRLPIKLYCNSEGIVNLSEQLFTRMGISEFRWPELTFRNACTPDSFKDRQ